MSTVKTILSIMVIFVLASCGTSTPVATAIPIPTNAPHPTATAKPTATVTPIPATSVPATSVPTTSVPTISQVTAAPTVASQTLTNGPYLVFLRDRGNGQELVLMDADGKGEVAFPFPINSNVYIPQSLSNLVSPDGSWLAFYTGSDRQASGNVGTDTADLTLNLMSLGITSPAGSTKVVSRLLSADYPANFVQAARELDRADITAQALQDAFVYGITQSIAWSPDGKYLAFASQMDGLSSDLYLYNTADGTIQQLSSGPEEVMWIAWSPDRKWILDASLYLVGEGMTYNLYATSLDGQVVRRLLVDNRLSGALIWVNTHEFLTYQSENGRGNFGLVRVDVESGNVDNVWDGSFASLAVDPTGNWLAFNVVPEMQAAETGLFLVNLATLEKTKFKDPDPIPDYGIRQGILNMSNGSDQAFLIRNYTDRGMYFLSTSGVFTSTGISADLFDVAPNQVDWIAIKNNIQLFTAGGSQARIFNLPVGTKSSDFQRILWRPDSSGIFLESNNHQLYALDFSSGISTVVEQYLSVYDPVTGIPDGLIWVRK
jgi:Tol biopolymer transport system component